MSYFWSDTVERTELGHLLVINSLQQVHSPRGFAELLTTLPINYRTLDTQPDMHIMLIATQYIRKKAIEQ